jgi:hypothetical protein
MVSLADAKARRTRGVALRAYLHAGQGHSHVGLPELPTLPLHLASSRYTVCVRQHATIQSMVCSALQERVTEGHVRAHRYLQLKWMIATGGPGP